MIKRPVSMSLGLGLCLVSLCHAATEYKIDKNHSTIGFSIPIMGLGKVTGKFTDFDVQLTLDDADITQSSVRAVIQTASIDTGIDDRDAHLRTADFFDAETHPEIVFVSSRVVQEGERFIATGRLTMHGVSEEIAIPFSIHRSDLDEDARSFTANVSLSRKRFGVGSGWRHSTLGDAFLGDEVDVQITLLSWGPQKDSK